MSLIAEDQILPMDPRSCYQHINVNTGLGALPQTIGRDAIIVGPALIALPYQSANSDIWTDTCTDEDTCINQDTLSSEDTGSSQDTGISQDTGHRAQTDNSENTGSSNHSATSKQTGSSRDTGSINESRSSRLTGSIDNKAPTKKVARSRLTGKSQDTASSQHTGIIGHTGFRGDTLDAGSMPHIAFLELPDGGVCVVEPVDSLRRSVRLYLRPWRPEDRRLRGRPERYAVGPLAPLPVGRRPAYQPLGYTALGRLALVAPHGGLRIGSATLYSDGSLSVGPYRMPAASPIEALWAILTAYEGHESALALLEQRERLVSLVD